MTPAGSIEAKGPQVFIRLNGAIDDLQAIRSTPVAAQARAAQVRAAQVRAAAAPARRAAPAQPTR